MLFFVVVVYCWYLLLLFIVDCFRENEHYYTLHCFKDFLNDHVLRVRTKRLSLLFNAFLYLKLVA